MRKLTKRSAAITAAAVVAIGAGGAAFAAATGWDIGGTGSAQADTATILPLTATANMGAAKVFPGLVTTVSTAVSNPNDFPVSLNQTPVVPTGVTVTVGTGAAACQTHLSAHPEILTASFPAWNSKITAGAVGQAATADVAISNTLPQSCAGSHIVITYTFTGTSTV
jgi:hypothetical protein